MHFPRTYSEEQENKWPLDKHGVYIFPEDKILFNGVYFKVVELSREVAEEDSYSDFVRYQWFVECQYRKLYCIYKFPADICVNCSEKKVRPPFSYLDEVKERASFSCGQRYAFASQGLRQSIGLIRR